MKNNWKRNLLYIIIIILYFFIAIKISHQIYEQKKIMVRNFSNSIFLISIRYVLKFLSNILFALIIKFEYVLDLIKNKGTLVIDKNKMYFVCLPLLIFSLSEIFYFIVFGKIDTKLALIFRPLLSYAYNLLPLVQILFWSTLISCFYKDAINIRDNSLEDKMGIK